MTTPNASHVAPSQSPAGASADDVLASPAALPDARRQARRDGICVHIFTTSATLVGVCLTVIGLLRIVQRLRNVGTLTDILLSVNAIGFLAACVTAYVALRADDPQRRRRVERVADVVFLSALGLMTVICSLIAMELL